ncbi:MAG: glycosyltransferase [Solobacterium sp.]|nr:glycosyltransferase [Solobacterium sp.]
MKISVVIPEYGCREAIFELNRRLEETLNSLGTEFEIIYVEDRDPQNSWEDIKVLCEKDPHVRGIHFTRNFGQECAIMAGLKASTGDYAVVMDCDLQDPPEGIKDLYEKVREGYDIVYSRRRNRRDSFLTRLSSRMFYAFYNLMTDEEYDPLIGNFSIASRRAIDSCLSMNEKNRGYIMFLRWLGYPSAVIDLEAQERAAGKSGYNLVKKIRYAVQEISSQSNKPLTIAIYVGSLFALISLIMIVCLLIRHFFDGSVPEGWISLMISIYLVGGIILMVLGIHGIYVGNIFTEVKNRPMYVIEEVVSKVYEKPGLRTPGKTHQ